MNPNEPMMAPNRLYHPFEDNLVPRGIHYDSPAFAVVQNSPEESFVKELAALINKYSFENRGDIPDFIGATFMLNAYKSFAQATEIRDHYFNLDNLKGTSTNVK
jgi:hypothetical protein